jgi:hypothetical protein
VIYSGDVSWEVVLVFVALALGFRPDPVTHEIVQSSNLAPNLWTGLEHFPDILHDPKCLQRMQSELPRNPTSVNSIEDEDPSGNIMLRTVCALLD